MSELFILQNQHKLYLGKQNQWVDGRELNALFKTPHRDEAINQMVEASSKDFTQRIKVVSCSANDKGLPELDPEMMPEPLPKPVKDLFDTGAEPASDEPDESARASDLNENEASENAAPAQPSGVAG